MLESEIQRILAGRDERTIRKEWEYADWVAQLAGWDTYFTGTFRWPASVASATRCFRRWSQENQGGVPTFFGVDPNPSGDGGHHVHGIMATSGGCYRRGAWATWFARYGVARVLPISSIGGLSGYLAKYPLSGARWWDFFNCHAPVFQFRRADRLGGRPGDGKRSVGVGDVGSG